MLDLSILILTYNEELHIARAIESVLPVAKEVFIVDSFSTDNTVEIARSMGAKVYQNKWENNHAKQVNWGLDNLPISTAWVMRLDADEYLTPGLIEELNRELPRMAEGINGIVVHRKQYFFGKLMHPVKILRAFRYGKAVCEQRWVDEHMQLLEGVSVEFDNMLIDDNRNSLGWWIQKHNGYSIREAIELLNLEVEFLPNTELSGSIGKASEVKRRQKLRYARYPLFWRSFAYFFYRYILKFGFVQGRARFLWDFFQGWWYRTLVDAKIYEIKRACGKDKEKICDYIKQHYGIDCRNI